MIPRPATEPSRSLGRQFRAFIRAFKGLLIVEIGITNVNILGYLVVYQIRIGHSGEGRNP